MLWTLANAVNNTTCPQAPITSLVSGNHHAATESSTYGDSDLRITLRIRSFKMDYAYPAFASNLLSRRIGQIVEED